MEKPPITENDERPPEKINIYTQPIFLFAMVLVVFNVLLYFWSQSRDSKSDDPVKAIENSAEQY